MANYSSIGARNHPRIGEQVSGADSTLSIRSDSASAPLAAGPTADNIQVSRADVQNPPPHIGTRLPQPSHDSARLWPHFALLYSSTAIPSVPFHKTAFSGRAFRCTARTTWNSLPNIVTAADSLTSFKSRLKTRLFNQTFRPIPS